MLVVSSTATWLLLQNAIRRELLDVARNLLQGLGDRLVKAEGNGPEAPQKSPKSKASGKGFCAGSSCSCSTL